MTTLSSPETKQRNWSDLPNLAGRHTLMQILKFRYSQCAAFIRASTLDAVARARRDPEIRDYRDPGHAQIPRPKTRLRVRYLAYGRRKLPYKLGEFGGVSDFW